jgi:hypothetical protein
MPPHPDRRDGDGMNEPATYEIVVRGRPSDRLLRPLLDDFAVSNTQSGGVRLVGEIRDGSHLHGILAHLTTVNVEIVLVAPLNNQPEGPRDLTPRQKGARP